MGRFTLCCVSLETWSSSKFYRMILFISRVYYSTSKESEESLIIVLLNYPPQVTVQNPCLYELEINHKVALVLEGIERIHNSVVPSRTPCRLPRLLTLAPLWALSICKSTYKNKNWISCFLSIVCGIAHLACQVILVIQLFHDKTLNFASFSLYLLFVDF